MREIAIYGKGGIGKSTLTSNISASMALCGERVLQIGCDPKHDSTRLLMHGERITTVLDYIRDTAMLDQKPDDILFTGYHGTGCIEAGGPKPGVGCAGRGIITAFELLDRFHIKEKYDTVMYDVLGDVVCGGFAVPIRREYANEIFVVTSGEYMSIYAANNILRGIANYDTDTPRVAGIIYNSRNVVGERERVQKFAGAVGLPIFAEVPRSNVFAECEKRNMTAVEITQEQNNRSQGTDKDNQIDEAGWTDGTGATSGIDGASKTYGADRMQDIADIFTDIAGRIIKGVPHFMARPLTDEELEYLIMGTELISDEEPQAKSSANPNNDGMTAGSDNGSSEILLPDGTKKQVAWETASRKDDQNTSQYFSKNVIRDEPLHGCAFNGATCMSIHIKDAKILLHSPKSCAYISWQTISSTGRRELYERGSVLTSSLLPGLDSTNMTESDMVFGGTDKLTEHVRKIVESPNHPKALIVISACPSGIIGDDIDRVKALSTSDCPVITVKADGNLTGDYMQGMLMAYTELAKQIIDPDVKTEPDTVNIVFEKVVIKNAEDNFAVIKSFLDRMGVKVNCRFLYNAPFDSVKNFGKASLNLLAYKDFTGKILEKFFSENYGSKFFDREFPVGYQNTCDWVRGVATAFDKKEIAEEIIEENRERYYSRIKELRPYLEGKKLMIITFNHELDWILGAALDCGMEIVKLCILNYSQDEGFRTSIPEVRKLNIVENYDREQRAHDIETLKPDIVLGNYTSDKLAHDVVLDTIPMCPDVGFFSGLDLVERWCSLVRSEKEGEWQNDRRLFEQYYA